MFLKRSLSLVAVAVIITASALPAFASSDTVANFPITRWTLTGNSMYYECVYPLPSDSSITVFRTSYIQWFLPSSDNYLPPDFSVHQYDDSFHVDLLNNNNDITLQVRVTTLEMYKNSVGFSVPTVTNQEFIFPALRGQSIFSFSGSPLSFRSFGTDDANPFVIDSEYSISYDVHGVDLNPILLKLDDIFTALAADDSYLSYIDQDLLAIYDMLDSIRFDELETVTSELYSIRLKLDSILELLGSDEPLTQPTIPNQSKYDSLEQNLLEGTVPNFSQYSEQVTVNGNALSLVIQLFDDIVHINPAVFSLVIISLVVGVITLVLGRNKQ